MQDGKPIHKSRFRPSPALLVASLALFVALGSGAYAAGIIDGHSIKNHSIPRNKLTKAAVASLFGASVVREG